MTAAFGACSRTPCRRCRRRRRRRRRCRCRCRRRYRRCRRRRRRRRLLASSGARAHGEHGERRARAQQGLHQANRADQARAPPATAGRQRELSAVDRVKVSTTARGPRARPRNGRVAGGLVQTHPKIKAVRYSCKSLTARRSRLPFRLPPEERDTALLSL